MHFSGKIDRGLDRGREGGGDKGVGWDDCILTRKFSRLGDHEPPAPPVIRNRRARAQRGCPSSLLSPLPPSSLFYIRFNTPQNGISILRLINFFVEMPNFSSTVVEKRSRRLTKFSFILFFFFLLIVAEIVSALGACPTQFRSRFQSIPRVSCSFHTPALASHPRGAQPCPFFPPCVRGTRCERSNPIGAQLRSDFAQDRSPLSPFWKILIRKERNNS